MIEVHPGLFVGDDADALAALGDPGWFVIHACKEPYHRAALGYTSHGAPKGDPEYLFARRGGTLALNLVDAADPAYIPPAVIAAALEAITAHIGKVKVLVHCNQGRSRSPTIALLWMALATEAFDDLTYDQAASAFTYHYPPFAPNSGMAGFARLVWLGELALPSGQIEPDPEPIPAIQPEQEDPKPRPAVTIFRM